jgi:transcriptional regulator with XRE-family HTH domain
LLTRLGLGPPSGQRSGRSLSKVLYNAAMKEDAAIDQGVRRIAKLLKAAVQFLGVPHRQIERSMGLSTGYLSRIFSGKVELRMEHVLGICAAVNLSPGAFFEAAYPLRELDRNTARLVAALRELMPESEEPLPKGELTAARKAGPSREALARERARDRIFSRAKLATQMLEDALAELGNEDLDFDFEEDL